VSQLQEALFGLNRRILAERKSDSNPLQGIRNTLGSLKDELFADDDWDDWDRTGRDSWSSSPSSRGRYEADQEVQRRRDEDRWSSPRPATPRTVPPPAWDDRDPWGDV
jgi:molecular chaperone DnaK